MALNLDPQQLQQLAMMVQQQQGVMGASSAYQPQFSTTDMMRSGTGMFSFGQTMGKRFGASGAQLGMMADLFLPIFMGQDYTDFMSRFQVASGGDLLAQQGARRYSSLVSAMGARDVGNIISQELGTVYDPEAHRRVIALTPIADQMLGGMVSDVARMVDPTLMTQQGAMGIVSAQRRSTSMGRLDENRVQMLRTQIQDRTSIGRFGSGANRFRLTREQARLDDRVDADKERFRFRDDDFTSGFNIDEFAEMTAIAADLGLRDFAFANGTTAAERASIDATLRAQATAELQRRRTGPGSDESIESVMSELRQNRAIIGAGRNIAAVSRSLQGAFGPDLKAGELGNLMTQMGMTPGSAQEAQNMTKIIENLRSLGEAAGMSAEQMRTAGQTIQQQFGGTASFAMGAAGLMGLTRRQFRDVANEQGRSFTAGGVVADLTGRFAEDQLGAQRAPFAAAAAAINQDPELRRQFGAAYAQGGNEGIANFIREYAQQNPGAVARARRMPDSRIQSGFASLFRGVEDSDQNMAVLYALRAGALERMSGRPVADAGRNKGEIDTDFFRNLDRLSGEDIDLLGQAFVAENLNGFTDDQRRRLQGMANRLGGGQDIVSLLNVARRAGPISDLMMTYSSERALARTETDRATAIRRREIMRAVQFNGMGRQGLDSVLELIRHPEGDLIGNINSVEGISRTLEAAGVLGSQQRAEFTRALSASPEVSDRMIADFRRLAEAQARANGTGATDADREAFKQAKNAITRDYGLNQTVDLMLPGVKEKLGRGVSSAMSALGDWIGSALGSITGGSGTKMNEGAAGANADGDAAVSGEANPTGERSANVVLNIALDTTEGLVASVNEAQSVNNGVDVRVTRRNTPSREGM